MTPKEKAVELVGKFDEADTDTALEAAGIRIAKRNALIAVDEIIKEHKELLDRGYTDTDIYDATKYWEKVKQEITKL